MEFLLFGRLLGACVVVGLVLFALQAIARRALRGSAALASSGRIVALLETTTLPQGASLHVLRVGERYLLVGRSASSVATLCEIPAEHVTAIVPAVGADTGFARRACHACRSLC